VAAIGPAGSGKEALGLLFARQVSLKTGNVKTGEDDLLALPEGVAGRCLAYVGPDAYFFPQSLRDNLLYGLKSRPPVSASRTDRRIREAIRTGNPEFDADADWLDYEAIGAKEPGDITARIIDVLTLVELESDVYQFGLQSRLDPKIGQRRRATHRRRASCAA
jgi:putative ABC transport system ATP-binding protein